MMHQSIATIDSPEFINLQPLEINPLMSSCEIKVLYLGENRNHSYITKEVATEMAKTLRGAPIVGYYKEDKGDFRDHGEKVIIDDEGVKFECLTKPYGFVSPDAKVWFQKFDDTDEFGNVLTREYLMTTGYLWTGQFEECGLAVKEGRPQSMELDSETLDGHWSTDQKSGMDFFIINDAIFSKLCILGEDVEPCFEGSSITTPEVSKTFALDNGFKNTLFTMMKELKFALEGGQDMELEENITTEEIVEEANVETPVASEEEEIAVTEEEQNEVEPVAATEEFSKEEEKDDEEDSKDADDSEEDNSDDEEEKDDEDKDKKYALLESEYEELKTQFTALQAENEELKAFKNTVELKEKDALIDSFYMLSEEDKEEIRANKENYSLDEINSKLCVICVEKKVKFDLEDTDKNDNKVEEKEDVITYSLDSDITPSAPAWISALRKTRDSKKD